MRWLVAKSLLTGPCLPSAELETSHETGSAHDGEEWRSGLEQAQEDSFESLDLLVPYSSYDWSKSGDVSSMKRGNCTYHSSPSKTPRKGDDNYRNGPKNPVSGFGRTDLPHYLGDPRATRPRIQSISRGAVVSSESRRQLANVRGR